MSIVMDGLSGKVGLGFVGGYGAGFVAGSFVGLARNIDELPMVKLNQTLNTATSYGEKTGYTAAMGVCVFEATKMMTRRSHVRIHPIAESAIAGGVTGAVIAANGGWKKAMKAGAAGCVLGAAIGAAMSLRREEEK